MKTELNIQNLKCGGCEATIIKRLSELDNIHNVFVDHAFATVAFQHKTDQDIKLVKSLLLKLGYPPHGEKNDLRSKAKSYVSCAIGRMNKED